MTRTLLCNTSLVLMVLATAAVLLPPDYADARGRGGGVSRAGPTSINRGGGGGGGRSMSSSRGGYGGGAASRPSAGSRDFGGGSRASTANRGQTRDVGNRTGNTVNRGGDRSRVNTGDRGSNNRINTGDVNIGGNNNINVDVDNGWGGIYDHPIAAGVAFGTAAAITTAAIGSMFYSLPPGCAPRPYGAYSYYYCGNTWYAPQYQGSTVTYVVVDAPQ